MNRYKNPGLPKFPALYWDQKTGKSLVEGKTKNWRSQVKSDRVMLALFLLGLVLLTPIAWDLAENRFPQFAILWVVGSVLVLTMVFVMSLVMNRTVFTPKQKITMTSEKIWIGRKSYPRENDGVPLSISFQIDPDPDAARRLATKKLGEKYRHMHNIARRVNMVIRASQSDTLFASMPQVGPGSVVLVAEVLGDEAASQFATVCTAAFTLTAVGPEAAPTMRGHDLDGPI